MMLMEKYKEKVKVLHVDINEITYEEEIRVYVNQYYLNCFVSNYLTKGKFENGEMVEVVFTLMTTGCEKVISKEKNIFSTDQFHAHCILSGELMGFTPMIRVLL